MGGLLNPKKKREAELAALMDEFDTRTGTKPRVPTPWHKEPKLSKGKQEALDALEPQKKRSGGFYQEKPEQKAQQDAFDQALKNVTAPGTGTWQAGPVSKRDRLISWHKALGSPQHVVDAELKALEQQETRK
jgi:hypothetical protein